MTDLTLNLDPQQRQEVAELLRIAGDAQRETARTSTSRRVAEALRTRAGRAYEMAEWFESAEAVAVEVDMMAADDEEAPGEQQQHAELREWLADAAAGVAEMEPEG